MGCGHVFCIECWRQHCKVQIKDGRSRKLPCMGVKCGAACDEEKVVTSPACCYSIVLNKHLIPIEIAGGFSSVRTGAHA